MRDQSLQVSIMDFNCVNRSKGTEMVNSDVLSVKALDEVFAEERAVHS